MTKRIQLIVFVLVVVLGIFLMDRFLFPKGEDCRCLDFELAEADCWAACYMYGECAMFYAITHPGSCFYSSCVYKMLNYCIPSEGGPGKAIIGYVYSSYCSDCYGGPI